MQVDCEAIEFIVRAGMVPASGGPHLRIPHGIFGTVTIALGSIGAAGGFVTTSVHSLRKRLRSAHNDGYPWYLAGRPTIREVLGEVLNEFLQFIRSLEGIWLDEAEQNIGLFDDRYVS